MRNMGELIPSEQDEAIYAAWQSGKSLRVLAHEFRVSRMEIERAIDRVLPIFDTKSEMRAYKREIHKLEDLGAEFHALAMRDKSPEFAHVTARINERICAMRGWTSMNVRLDLFSAQTEQSRRNTSGFPKRSCGWLSRRRQLSGPYAKGWSSSTQREHWRCSMVLSICRRRTILSRAVEPAALIA